MNFYKIIRPIIFKMEAERAHNTAIKLLRYGLVPAYGSLLNKYTNKNRFQNNGKLGIVVAGIGFDSPVGMAAGFDKNAEIFGRAFQQGFGFAEVGTVTPQPQQGNPQPRLFRLEEDGAIINRMGFNNAGMEAARTNIDRHEVKSLYNIGYNAGRLGVLGVNIGKNKTTENALDDYLIALEYMYDVADYITINISSPNTNGLRDLQQLGQFEEFIKAIMQERNVLASFRGFSRPIFVKLAPDMSDDELRGVLEIMMLYKANGVILTNTTIARPSSLKSIWAKEQGGLSGAPLKEGSLHALRIAREFVGQALPIISVGGIMNGADAVARIRAGASLVQIYSGLVYSGFSLVEDIKSALLAELEKENMYNIEQLIGVEVNSK